MEENDISMIDKYLRGELEEHERLELEQRAINDEQFRGELKLTYQIKLQLADRQRKLRKTNEWRHRKRNKSVRVGLFVSIAATLLIGYFVLVPKESSTDGYKETVMTAALPNSDVKNVAQAETVTEKVRAKDNDSERIVASDDPQEHEHAIPQIGGISESRTMSAMTDTQKQDTSADGLNWHKINFLLSTGKTEEALILLHNSTFIEGRYKAQADSLLRILNSME